MLSVAIITKNEQERIKTCLQSVKWADEVIIVDNGSTDKTLEVLSNIKYRRGLFSDENQISNIKIYKFNGADFALLRNKAMELAKGDWVLFVDADERVLDPLKKEIEVMISFSDFSAYAISRRNVIFGTEVKYGSFWPDWVIRLLKKSDFDSWVGKVHEYPKFEGKLGYSKNSLLHLTHRNIDQIVLKSLEWSKIDAKLRLDANHPKMSGWRFLRIFITEIFNQGILRKGFFNGTVGIMDSILQAFSLYITYIRLWEMQQGKSLEDVYRKIDEQLLKNEFQY